MSFTSVCIIALLAHVGAAAPSKLADTLDSVRELATHNKSVAHAAPALLHSLALHERARALYGEHHRGVKPSEAIDCPLNPDRELLEVPALPRSALPSSPAPS